LSVAVRLAELEALTLPGLPRTRRGLLSLAERAGWDRQTKAGAHLYTVTGSIADAVLAARRAKLEASRPARSVAANDMRRPVGRPKGVDYWSANPDVADAIRLILGDYAHAATRIEELLLGQFSDRMPHIANIRRFVARLEREEKAALERTRNPDWYKSNCRVSLGRADGDVSAAHQAWELDTTPTDVTLIGGRYAILGVIDRWSRRVRLVLAPSESGQSVRALLVRAVTDWNALPNRIVVDNGSGYVNATVKSACELLDIVHDPCLPGSPERKPFVERLFGTFTRERSAMIPGFVGHNVADAQRLRAREKKKTGRAEIVASVTVEEFQAILDAWVVGVYEQRVHGTTRQAPIARAMASPVPARAAPDSETLRRSLSVFVGNLTVGKRGLRFKNERYWSPELAGLILRTVHVRRDEGDLGELFVFDGDGTYICTAVNHLHSGVSEQDFALAARQDQLRLEKVQRAEERERKRNFSIADAKSQILRRDAEAAGKLLTLPVVARETPVQALSSVVETAVHNLPQTSRPQDDISVRVARADKLIADDKANYSVDPDQLAWAKAFVNGLAYAAFQTANQPAGSGAPILPFTRKRLA
jgi:putative transposase